MYPFLLLFFFHLGSGEKDCCFSEFYLIFILVAGQKKVEGGRDKDNVYTNMNVWRLNFFLYLNIFIFLVLPVCASSRAYRYM